MPTYVKVNFMHPTDGRVVTVTLDDSMTAQEAINELISINFIGSVPLGYNLAIKLVTKGRERLEQNRTLAEAGVKEGDILRVALPPDGQSWILR